MVPFLSANKHPPLHPPQSTPFYLFEMLDLHASLIFLLTQCHDDIFSTLPGIGALSFGKCTYLHSVIQ